MYCILNISRMYMYRIWVMFVDNRTYTYVYNNTLIYARIGCVWHSSYIYYTRINYRNDFCVVFQMKIVWIEMDDIAVWLWLFSAV